ncbi:MAG TPA: hypothetical protein DEO64_00835 [Alcaligenes faecalis]|nr:hypothetical protein [Alcaligenes faecalis]
MRCTEAFLAEFLAFMSDSDLKCKHALKGLLIDIKQMTCQVFYLAMLFIFVLIKHSVVLVFVFFRIAILVCFGIELSLYGAVCARCSVPVT